MEAHQAVSEIESLSVTGPSPVAAVVRRCIDLLLASAVLLLLAPLLLVIAVAVRIDSPGPALFRQRRLGCGRSPFVVNKFRTMQIDCDETRHRDFVCALISGTESGQTGESVLYKLHGDDRVTRVGRLLRRWSLDELPQLWNVVRGEMSLAGPRPVMQYEEEAYPDWYGERFAVKPGMTGLWQVSGRNERTYDEMVRLDIEYVRRRTIWLDLSILLKTAWVVVCRRGVA